MHTARLSINVTEITKKIPLTHIDILLNEINKKKGLTGSFKQLPYNKEFVYINVDFVELLGSFEVNQHNLDLAIDLIYDSIPREFLNDTEVKIQRLDFRYDAKIENDNDRHTLIKLIQQKSFRKFKFKYKQPEKDTTVYFNSKSSHIIVYDKEEERTAKDIEPKEEEKDTLRFENSIDSKHFNYMKRQYGIEKSLENYLTVEMYNKYILGIIDILGDKDFHKFKNAEEIIVKSKLSKEDKKLCKDFLNDVTRSSLSQVKLKKVNGRRKYSEKKIKEIIRQLSELNINPLILSKHWKCSETIENPLRNALIKSIT